DAARAAGVARAGAGRPRGGVRVSAPGTPAAAPRAAWRDYVELTKPRIVAAGTVAALAGFLAANPRGDGAALVRALAGIAGITAAAGILNQVIERDVDARMPRTMNRPLPAGRIPVATATTLGVALAAASLLLLATASRPLTAALAFFAF